MKLSFGHDRRQSERRRVDAQATVSIDDHEPLVVDVLDLSDGGVFLRHSSGPRLEVGEVVFVEIRMSDHGDQDIVARARVVRVTPAGTGLQFVD